MPLALVFAEKKIKMHSSMMRTQPHITLIETPSGQRPPDRTPPPVDRQTPVKTLPSQTSFARGNKFVFRFQSNLSIAQTLRVEFRSNEKAAD